MVLGLFSRIRGTWFPYLDGRVPESFNKGTEFPYFPSFDGSGSVLAEAMAMYDEGRKGRKARKAYGRFVPIHDF